MVPEAMPLRVMRVVARMNVGGPARRADVIDAQGVAR
jgi:hypothetical protein